MAVNKSLVALRNNTEAGFLNVTDADGISQAQDNASKIEIVRAIDANLTRVITADTDISPDTNNSHAFQIGTVASRFATIRLAAFSQVQLTSSESSFVTMSGIGASISNTVGGNKSISVSQLTGILLLDQTTNPRGLRGDGDYTANIQQLDYTQRKYVDTASQNSSATFAVDSSVTVNEIVIALTPAVTAYQEGQHFSVKIANTNTGSTTIAVNGLAALNVVDTSNANISAGTLIADSIYTFVINESSPSVFTAQVSRSFQNADNRPADATLTTFNTDTTVDASLGKRLLIALTADREVSSITNLVDPTFLSVSGNFNLSFGTGVEVIGNNNYLNAVIRISRGIALGTQFVAEFINDPGLSTEENALTGLSVDMGEESNNIMTLTVVGTQDVSITNPMLNGAFKIRATGGTDLTVNSQTPQGDAYTSASTNVIYVECVRITPSPQYVIINNVI